jgi:hypothetical protein
MRYFTTMSDEKPLPAPEIEYLRTAIHDLNNHLGIMMATAELLQMGMPDGRSRSRLEVIESKALEAREILKEMSRRYFD